MLYAIRRILDAKGRDADNVEKMIRIAWAIGNLPDEIRETIMNEAQNRVRLLGRTSPIKPDEFNRTP